MRYAWHVSNGLTRSGETQPLPGQGFVHLGPIEWLKSGLYASWRLLDCLPYATGSVIQRVAVGDIEQEGPDKFACRVRKCVWIRDCETELRDFARWAALDAFRHTETELNPVLRDYLLTGDGADFARDLARLCGSEFEWETKYDPYEMALYDAAFAACWQNSWDSVGYPAHIAARDAAWQASFAIARYDASKRASRPIGRAIWKWARMRHEEEIIRLIGGEHNEGL